jgi:hypothetical protein
MHSIQNRLYLGETLFERSLDVGSIEDHKLDVFPAFTLILPTHNGNYLLEVCSLCPQFSIEANICWELFLKPIWWVENIAISCVHSRAIPIASHTV